MHASGRRRKPPRPKAVARQRNGEDRNPRPAAAVGLMCGGVLATGVATRGIVPRRGPGPGPYVANAMSARRGIGVDPKGAIGIRTGTTIVGAEGDPAIDRAVLPLALTAATETETGTRIDTDVAIGTGTGTGTMIGTGTGDGPAALRDLDLVARVLATGSVRATDAANERTTATEILTVLVTGTEKVIALFGVADLATAHDLVPALETATATATATEISTALAIEIEIGIEMTIVGAEGDLAIDQAVLRPAPAATETVTASETEISTDLAIESGTGKGKGNRLESAKATAVGRVGAAEAGPRRRERGAEVGLAMAVEREEDVPSLRHLLLPRVVKDREKEKEEEEGGRRRALPPREGAREGLLHGRRGRQLLLHPPLRPTRLRVRARKEVKVVELRRRTPMDGAPSRAPHAVASAATKQHLQRGR